MVNEELDRDRPLFDARIPVEVKRPDLAERKEVVELTLRVLSGTRQGGPSGAPREKVLHIEITDDEDAFYLFSLDVGEEDFHELKRDQSLLVDFNAFPNKFIELVESCLSSSSTAARPTRATSAMPSRSAAASEPHFIARLDPRGPGSSTAVFSLVEANQFKELTHLSLHFRPGNDTTVKVYLAERLRQVMGERDRLSSALAKSEEQLRAEAHRSKGLDADLQRLLTSREQDIRELKAAHMEELSQQREELVREAEGASHRHAAEVRDLQARKDDATARLQSRLDETEAKRSALSDQRHANEATIRELSKRIEAMEASLEAADSELKGLRSTNRELETAKFGLEKEVNKLQMRMAALEQQVSDREQMLAKSTALQTAAEQARAKVEESLELYKANSAALQEKLEASVSEINKGNDIIQRIQSEYRALKTKLRLKSDVIKQQERLLDEREHALEDANRRLQASADGRAALEEQVARLKKDLATATSKLEESNKLIESNQQVITWLNKEMNEAQLGRGAYAATPTPAFTPAYHPEAALTPTMDDTLLRRYTTPTATSSSATPGDAAPSSSTFRRFLDPMPKGSSLTSFA